MKELKENNVVASDRINVFNPLNPIFKIKIR